MSLRIHLTGRMSVSGPAGTVSEEDLPGRQSRLLLAYLLLHGRHPAVSDTIAHVVWDGRVPASWESLLKSLVSRTRSALRATGAAPERLLVGLGGTYQLRLPAGTWVDVEICARSIDQAEAALRRGEVEAAWADAAVASAITRRPLLPKEDAPWLEEARGQLRSARIRTLDVLTAVWLARDAPALALALATESVHLAPLRESSWRLEMRAHAAAGDHAEALYAYERCTQVLRRELGVEPAGATRDLRDQIRSAAARTSARPPSKPQP